MSLLSRLLSPCALGHATTWHYGPKHQHKLCDRCLQPIGLVLSGEMITTQLHQEVAGQPTGTAQRVKKQNISEFRKQSER